MVSFPPKWGKLRVGRGGCALGVRAGGVGVHLVDADEQLLDAEQVDEARVLAGLALDLTGLVVALLDGGGEVTVGGDHEERDVRRAAPEIMFLMKSR